MNLPDGLNWVELQSKCGLTDIQAAAVRAFIEDETKKSIQATSETSVKSPPAVHAAVHINELSRPFGATGRTIEVDVNRKHLNMVK